MLETPSSCVPAFYILPHGPMGSLPHSPFSIPRNRWPAPLHGSANTGRFLFRGHVGVCGVSTANSNIAEFLTVFDERQEGRPKSSHLIGESSAWFWSNEILLARRLKLHAHYESASLTGIQNPMGIRVKIDDMQK